MYRKCNPSKEVERVDRPDPSWLGFDELKFYELNIALSRIKYRAFIQYAYDRHRPKGFESENLEVKNPLSALDSGERRTFSWRVFDDYDFKGYMSVTDTANLVREYEPLLEAPNLFLEFAELYSSMKDTKTYSTAAMLWIHNYGLLGLHPSEELVQRPGSNKFIPRRVSEKWYTTLSSISDLNYALPIEDKYDDRGGPEESIELFNKEISYAARVLNLYKAALSKNEQKLEEVLDVEGISQRVPGYREHFREYIEQKTLKHAGSSDYVAGLVDAATRQLSLQVQSYLAKFAYPSIGTNLSDLTAVDHISPQTLTASLWPRNLLGAMYLQFYWMITSGSALTYCKYCGNPISYAPTMPDSGQRKTYKNKQFCTKQCRQNYNYHNRIKGNGKR